MFHPAGMPLERGWVGRIEGDEVVHLASQTLQHLFTGGGTARIIESAIRQIRNVAASIAYTFPSSPPK